MITSRELRERAWRKLGEGNWLKAMGAFGLYWLMGMILAQVLRRIGIATGGIEILSVPEFMKQYGEAFRQIGLEIPSEVLKGLDEVTVPVTTPAFQVCQFVVGTFMHGVFLAGWAIFSVALMRNAGNALQVFSGFSRFFQMGWLMLLQTVRIMLWSLLLVIPGFVAFYSYRLAFFLKADHPEWSAWKVLAESKRMMYRSKLRLAYLDATFIGWLLLVMVTFGIAAFFVTPYMGVTYAAFYEDLLDRAEARNEDAVPA